MFSTKSITVLALLALLAVLAACAIPIPTQEEPALDRTQIYATVIRQVYTVDHTFGQPPNFPNIYLMKTDTEEAQPDLEPAAPLSAETRAAIVSALADLPAQFTWVTSMDEVPRDDNGMVVDGAVITVGDILPQNDGSLHVTASIYFAMLGAGGQTYVLEQQDGAWAITGITGPVWIS